MGKLFSPLAKLRVRGELRGWYRRAAENIGDVGKSRRNETRTE